METDYQKLYNNLSVLLQDICQFLSGDKLGPLSHRDKKLVESLITRSKVQLQEIAKIEQLSVTEEYVDMDAKKVVVHEDEEEKLDIYSSVDDINKNMEPIVPEGQLCPYIDLPAKEANQMVKCGFMSMRRRFLLGFEKMKRVYGAIHNQWLVIYYTDKDVKPICTFNLKNYEAKESDDPKSANFELIGTLDQKVYYFMALTPKDMLQWVVHINRCHDNVVLQSKGLDLDIDDDDVGEHYDTVVPGSDNRTEQMDEEEIYLELDDLRSPQNNNTISQKKTESVPDVGPPLPGRPQKGGLIPISPPLVKQVNPIHDSENSLASYDDITEFSKTTERSLDDEDDTAYESFIHVQHKVMKMSVSLPPENEVKEPKGQVKVMEIVTTEEKVSESNNINIKEKIDKYKNFESSTVTEVVQTDEEKKQKSSNINQCCLVQEIIKKNTVQNPAAQSKDGTDVTKNSNSKFASDTNKGKGSGGLNPPVIRKVPVVPLKPKVRDKPSIGKRPPFGGFKHMTDNS